MMARAPLLISILNWNGLADTLACLAALEAQHLDEADELPWQVLVIDNGSRDDPRAELAARFPAVELLRLARNAGFAAGQNHGLRLALARGHEAVLMLNNDCEIDGAAIAAMLRQLRAEPGLAALSPLIYCLEAREKPQMVAAWLDWGRHCSVRPSTPTAPRPPGLPAMLPGTALMLRCEALAGIGLLDERYFAYYEDNELSARIAAHGMAAAYCQQARAWHASRPVRQYSELALYLSARNAWLFWREHTPAARRRGLFRHLLAQSLVEIASLRAAGEAAKCEAVVAGFWDAQWRRFGAPPARLRSPWWLRQLMCRAPFLLSQLLADPRAALRARLARWRRPA
jgi:GT2 family glycosyltransferase